MRLVLARHDERGDVEPHQVLGLGTGRGVAIEERAAGARHHPLVMLNVQPRIVVGEGGIALDGRGPRTSARIGAERLALAGDEIHYGLQSILLHELEMLGEALLALDAIARAAHGPPQDHAEHALRMRDAECEHRRAAHAPAHEVGLLDAEVVEQPAALRDVMAPRHPLHAPAGLPGLAPIEDDAGVLLRQVLHRLHARVDAERGPLLEGRVEAAGREHQQRRARADHLVARAQPVDGGEGHRQAAGFTTPWPRMWRPPRTSSA
jgi:hypothetical protein